MISCFTDGKLGPCASLNEAVRGAVIASGYSTPTTRKPERGKQRRCLLMHSKQDDECMESPCGASASFKNIFRVCLSLSFLTALMECCKPQLCVCLFKQAPSISRASGDLTGMSFAFALANEALRIKYLKYFRHFCSIAWMFWKHACVCVSRGLESYEIGLSLYAIVYVYIYTVYFLYIHLQTGEKWSSIWCWATTTASVCLVINCTSLRNWRYVFDDGCGEGCQKCLSKISHRCLNEFRDLVTVKDIAYDLHILYINQPFTEGSTLWELWTGTSWNRPLPSE